MLQNVSFLTLEKRISLSIHNKLFDLVKEYCDRALALAIELGIPLVKECEELKQQLEEKDNGSNS
jgi:hypothetical protein